LAKLDKHFAAVLMLMKYAPNWKVFMDRLDHEFPQWGDNLMLPFPDDYTPPPESAELFSGGLACRGRHQVLKGLVSLVCFYQSPPGNEFEAQTQTNLSCSERLTPG